MCVVLAIVLLFGQAPVGSVSGCVIDSAREVITNATILVRQEGSGVERKTFTNANGDYLAANLPPGSYILEARKDGFRTEWRRVSLRAGDNPRIDFSLIPGSPEERVEVSAETPGINTSEYKVSGSVGRIQVETLPLNGRNFLELAQLEPSVHVLSTSNPGFLGNNFQQVLFGGAYYTQTRISIDGSTITDRFAGGTTQNFSQESVQEFQVSSFNLDVTTGTGASGAINIVTRQGTNSWHGSGFFYYRDHNLGAYPGLARDPRNPDPFFARRQAGFNLSGPIKKNRLFWFTNYENNNQDAVFAVSNNHPIFSKLDGIFPNPLTGNQFNIRLDANLSSRHQGFLRYSFDHTTSRTPAAAPGLPSNWQLLRIHAFQIQTGLISVLSQGLINDLRLSYSYLGGDLNPASPDECTDAVACVGVGGPMILVFDAAQFRIGNQMNAPFSRWQRSYQITDNVTWERGNHRIRFGGTWEHLYLKAALAFQEPAIVTLWGPSNLQTPALLPLYNALPLSLRDPQRSSAYLQRYPPASFS